MKNKFDHIEEAKRAWRLANNLWHAHGIEDKQERINGVLIDCLGYILGERLISGYEDKLNGK